MWNKSVRIFHDTGGKLGGDLGGLESHEVQLSQDRWE